MNRIRSGAENARHKKLRGFALKSLFVSFALLFFVSISSASLTIYFKDGSSKEVHKITFRGSVAELYHVDGTVTTVPVEKLDLASSGIGAPVGTYGTSKVTGERRTSDKTGVVANPLRQSRLQEEWERAEKSATVVSSIGPMRRGDIVKIIGETTANSRPVKDDYYDDTEYWYDPQYRGYRFKAKNLDHAYVIIYKNADGTFGKRLLDAATFSSHFKLEVTPRAPAPMPEYPIIPDEKDPDVRETSPFSTGEDVSKPVETADQPVPGNTAEELGPPVTNPPASETNEATDLEKSSRRRSWIAYLIFLGVLIALGFGAWYIIVRSQRPAIDTSKFSRYEEDLREFEIAIWLKNGKTAEQLMEICMKKFYQDSPSVLTVCNKMLKGTQKGLMVPFIAKQIGRSMPEAEKVYDQILNQIERIRGLIREVSLKTGIQPAKPPIDVTSPQSSSEVYRTVSVQRDPIPAPPPLPAKQPAVTTAAMPSVHQPQQPAPQPVVGNLTSSVAVRPAPEERSSSINLIEPEAPMRTATDLPQYANNVLNQISFLSSQEDK